jgi:hypothetical protein
MNRTQKRIIGWALVAIGTMMVVGVVANSHQHFTALVPRWSDDLISRYNLRQERMKVTRAKFDLGGLLVNPLFYIGVVLAVGGVVVLKGDTKGDKSTG